MGAKVGIWGATIRVLHGTLVRDVEKRKDVKWKKDWIGIAYSRRLGGIGVFTHWYFWQGNRLYYVHKDKVEVIGKEYLPGEIEDLIK